LIVPPKISRHRDEPPKGFDLFWEAFPRKVGKTPATDEYRKQLKSGTDPPTILLGADNYAAECRLSGRELQYICHPTTFLHQRRYRDYQEVPEAADFAPRIIGSARASPKTGWSCIADRWHRFEDGKALCGGPALGNHGLNEGGAYEEEANACEKCATLIKAKWASGP